MKRGVLVALFFSLVILLSTFASAGSYSFSARAVDEVKIALSSDEKKVEVAMDAREKQVDDAIEKAQEGDIEGAIESLEKANDKLEIIQEKTTPDIADDVKASTNEMEEKIIEAKEANPEFSEHLENYLVEEQKTGLSAELSEKLFNYCEELAKQNYDAMVEDEKCSPENAPGWMKKEIKEKMKDTQKESSDKMIEQLTICMNNPRECDCSEIPLDSEKLNCEKSKALSIRCEFQNDDGACEELKNTKIETPSNLPDFLKPLFQKTADDLIKKKDKEMFDKFVPDECKEKGATSRKDCENIMFEKHSPKECVDAGATTKDECEKIMVGIHGPPPSECMENGEFIGPDACEQKMVDSGMIPDECIVDGKPIPPEECNKIMEEKGIMMGPPEGEFAMGGFGKDMKIPPECVGLSFNECENMLMEKYIPQDCQGAGALTPESCRQIMLPKDCKDAGINSNYECETFMIEKNIDLPEECKQAGKSTPEECAGLLGKNIVVGSPGSEIDFLTKNGVGFDEVPDVCLKGSNFVRSVDCDDALDQMGITLPPPADISMVPPECVFDGVPVGPKDCENLLKDKFVVQNIPMECIEAGIQEPDECGKFMGKMKRDIGINMPPECFGVSPDECKKIMEEKGIMMPQVKECKEGEAGCEEEPEVCDEQGNCVKREPIPNEMREEPPLDFKQPQRECVELGVSDEASCGMIMSKINEERMIRGDKMIIDGEGNQEFITNDEINQIANDAEKASQEISQVNTERVDEYRQEVESVEQRIDVVASYVIDKSSMTKDNEDVSPSQNTVGDGVDPGPQGIVGVIESGGDGGDNVVAGGESSGGSESSGGGGSSSGGSSGESSGSESSSGEGGGESAPTGEAIREIKSGNSFFTKLFDKILGV